VAASISVDVAASISIDVVVSIDMDVGMSVARVSASMRTRAPAPVGEDVGVAVSDRAEWLLALTITLSLVDGDMNMDSDTDVTASDDTAMTVTASDDVNDDMDDNVAVDGSVTMILS
jgi:hypothetical protein